MSRVLAVTILTFAVLNAAAADDINVHIWKVLNRITWGATASDARRVSEIGLDVYLEQQLKPSLTLQQPSGAEMQVAGFRISTTPVERLVAHFDQDLRRPAQNHGVIGLDHLAVAFAELLQAALDGGHEDADKDARDEDAKEGRHQKREQEARARRPAQEIGDRARIERREEGPPADVEEIEA